MSSATNIGIKINVEGDAYTQVNSLKQNFSSLLGITNKIENISFAALTQNIKNLAETLQQAIAPGAEFEQQISDLQAITGIAGESLKDLESSARDVGKSSGLGAAQAAEAYKLLASNIDIATIGGVKGLKALGKETITLSQAAGVEMPTAANTMANTMNQFKLQGEEAARVINVLAAGAKYGAAEIPDLADSLKYVGPVAGTAGAKIEETVAAIEILSQSGIKGSMAGTDLAQIFIKLQSALGIDISKVGLPAALESLKPKLKDVTWLSKTFGDGQMKSIQTLIASSSELKEMTEKVTDTSVAYEQAEIRTSTYNHTVAKIKAQFDDLKISLFNTTGAFLPFVDVTMSSLTGLASLAPMIYMLKISFQALTPVINKATGSVTRFNIAAWANPIGLIVIAVIAAIAEITLLVIYWDELVEKFKKAHAVMKIALAPLLVANFAIIAIAFAIRKIIDNWNYIAAAFLTISIVITSAFDKIVAKIKKLWEVIQQNIIMPIIGAWQFITTKLNELWDFIINIFVSLWERIKNSFFEPLANVWELIKTPVIELWTWLSEMFDKLWRWFDAKFLAPFRKAWNKIASIFGIQLEEQNAGNESKTPKTSKTVEDITKDLKINGNDLNLFGEGGLAGGGKTANTGSPIISGDKAAIKNITINIAKLIDGGINISTSTLQEGTNKATDIVLNGLMTMVRDAEAAI